VAQLPLPKPRPPARRKPVEYGEWGLVAITRGRFKGHFAEYDDDESPHLAIVYVFEDDPDADSTETTVRLSSLGALTDAEKAWFHHVYDNELARARADRRWREMRARGEVRDDGEYFVVPESPSSLAAVKPESVPKAPAASPEGSMRADLHVTVWGSKEDTYLVHHCELPFIPTSGTVLFVGDRRGEGEFLEVDYSTYFVRDSALDVHLDLPKWETQMLEDGSFHKVKPEEYVPRLIAAGFSVEFKTKAIRDPKRKRRSKKR